MLPPPPTLTIVIASTGERGRLLADLASATPQCVRDEVELIVARADTPAGIAELGAAFPDAHFVGAPPATDLGQLRRLGLAAARGDAVALLDHVDDQTPSTNRWLAELRRRCALRRSRSRSESETDHASVPGQPYLSVVMPVHQGADVLTQSLEALAGSQLPRSSWELIVVDDASTDETPLIAARFADLVVRLPGRRHGTAYSRNRGFEFARGECVAFVNADVCVHPDALTRFVRVLSHEPGVAAVFGSFDTRPAAGGLVSQYRNLVLHYNHQVSPGAAETFWASCGAVRSAAFATVGMFDEWHFPRHQVEDFELGCRLREQGHRILVQPDIQATHLKRWTLRSMIAADLHDRSVPWIRLFHKDEGARPVDGGTDCRGANRELRAIKKANTALTWLAFVFVLSAILTGRAWLPLTLAAGICLAFVLRNSFPQHQFFARQRSVPFAIAVIPVDLLSYLVNGAAVVLGLLLREVIGEPRPHATIEAFSEIGVRTWPPVPTKRPTPAAGTQVAEVPPTAVPATEVPAAS